MNAHTLTLNRNQIIVLLAMAIIMLLPDMAWAATGTDGMPWEGPLQKIQKSMTGPVAMSISLIGVAVAGGMLIFGGELGEFSRKIIMLTLVVSLLVLANTIIHNLFGVSAAVVADVAKAGLAVYV